MHNRTDVNPAEMARFSNAADTCPWRKHMLLTIGALITLTALSILRRVWVPEGVNTAKLGWMSDQWLHEYRASQPT